MKCRICNRNMEDYSTIYEGMLDVTSIYSEFVLTPTQALNFYYCAECSHGQIKNVLHSNHYSNYNLLNVDSKKMTTGGGNAKVKEGYYKEVLQKLVGLAIDHEKFLDIGCGIGDILSNATDYFDDCIGVEPSSVECEIAQQKGLSVINQIFDSNFSASSDNIYSCFLATQVFEHLENPKEIICKAYSILKEGGIGYIDVPNGAKICNQGRYYDIYAEHLNYYSVNSLAKLTETVGFEIISIEEVFDGNHLAMIVRKPKMKISFAKKQSNDKNKLLKMFNDYNKISIWGAGIKGRVFIRMLEDNFQENLKYLFDNNLTLTNNYLGNCSLPIEAPTSDHINDNDLIIITAIEFKHLIIKELRENFNYKGDIWCIDEM